MVVDGHRSAVPVTPGSGLSAAEVAERVAAGRTNAVVLPSSRTLGEIVRVNLLTFFNGLLFVLLCSQFRSSDNRSWADAVTGTVAGLVVWCRRVWSC